MATFSAHALPSTVLLGGTEKIKAQRPQRLKGRRALVGLALLLGGLFCASPAGAAAPSPLAQNVQILSAYGDRSTGSEGARQAADYIEEVFREQGCETVGRFRLRVPVRRHGDSRLVLDPESPPLAVQPLLANSISPGTLPPEGLEGPLIYAGSGTLPEFNGLDVAGAIVLMEMTSGKNWQNAANLGARALIYVDRGATRRPLFQDKYELTPVDFPRFWISLASLQARMGQAVLIEPSLLRTAAKLTARIAWQNVLAENIYGLIPGRDETLGQQLIIVEAFYDSTAHVAGLSPGADEAGGIAALLELARYLKHHPPARSVLLLATAGHAQGLAGMREAVWSLHAKSKEFILRRKQLSGDAKYADKVAKKLHLSAWRRKRRMRIWSRPSSTPSRPRRTRSPAD